MQSKEEMHVKENIKATIYIRVGNCGQLDEGLHVKQFQTADYKKV